MYGGNGFTAEERGNGDERESEDQHDLFLSPFVSVSPFLRVDPFPPYTPPPFPPHVNKPSANPDVRMQGFAHRHTVQAALTWLDAQLTHPLEAELVPLREAAGRVLAAPVISGVDVPGFDRATMDGYAVVADSTEGATSYNRMPLRVVGDAMPGLPYVGSISSGEAVRIMTGAPIPDGADSVLSAEFAEGAAGPSSSRTPRELRRQRDRDGFAGQEHRQTRRRYRRGHDTS